MDKILAKYSVELKTFILYFDEFTPNMRYNDKVDVKPLGFGIEDFVCWSPPIRLTYKNIVELCPGLTHIMIPAKKMDGRDPKAQKYYSIVIDPHTQEYKGCRYYPTHKVLSHDCNTYTYNDYYREREAYLQQATH